MNREKKLMPLRIPTQWAVTYNHFYDVVPIKDEKVENGWYQNSSYFTEDLLQIIKTKHQDGHPAFAKQQLLIDLGYYPEGCVDGKYVLQLVKPAGGEMDWENAEQFKSKDRFEIQAKIEQWLEQYQNCSQ